MKIRFEMSVRNELPEFLNDLARRHGKKPDFDESKPIWLSLVTDWPAIPRTGESVWVLEDADPRSVERVEWEADGTAVVGLEDFDADEIGSESDVVEVLLAQGWEVDLSDFS